MSNKTRSNLATIHNLIHAAGAAEERLPSGPRDILATRREAAAAAMKELTYLSSLEDMLIEWLDAEDDFYLPHDPAKDYHEIRQRSLKAVNHIRRLYNRKPVFGEDKCTPPPRLLNGSPPSLQSASDSGGSSVG